LDQSLFCLLSMLWGPAHFFRIGLCMGIAGRAVFTNSACFFGAVIESPVLFALRGGGGNRWSVRTMRYGKAIFQKPDGPSGFAAAAAFCFPLSGPVVSGPQTWGSLQGKPGTWPENDVRGKYARFFVARLTPSDGNPGGIDRGRQGNFRHFREENMPSKASPANELGEFHIKSRFSAITPKPLPPSRSVALRPARLLAPQGGQNAAMEVPLILAVPVPSSPAMSVCPDRP